MALLPNVRHFKLHYNVPAIKNSDALKALTEIRSADLEICDNYNPDFISSWPLLDSLIIIREGKASVRPNFDLLGDLPNLQNLLNIGYHNGLEGLKRSKSLKYLTLQQLKVKSWHLLPEHKLDFLRLNAVRGPEPFDLEYLSGKTQKLDLLRMEKLTNFEPKRAFSEYIELKGDLRVGLSFNLDYLSQLNDNNNLNGHDWAEILHESLPPPEGITLDPEADGLLIVGDRASLATYKNALTVFFSKRLAADC